MELPKEKQIKDVRMHVYKCCFVDKIWTLANQLIRRTRLDFFKQIFINEQNHIDNLLKGESSFVLSGNFCPYSFFCALSDTISLFKKICGKNTKIPKH